MKKFFFLIVAISIFSCKSNQETDKSVKTIPVNKDYFIVENIIGGITEETIDLNGVETLCYIIKTHSQATEHKWVLGVLDI